MDLNVDDVVIDKDTVTATDVDVEASDSAHVVINPDSVTVTTNTQI
jgi:hypothetical protein